MDKLSYRRHRFPGIVIQQAVWLYFRFALSYRDVEDMLAERGIDVSYETVRRWALKFGTIIARKLRRGRPRPHGRWHLDEVFVSINGKQLYVWRAVDSEGEVLDILVQPRRDRKAAFKLMRKLLKKQGITPAKGCRKGAELWRRLQAKGFQGSLRVVGEWATRRRRAQTASNQQLQKVPSARTIAHLMTTRRDHMSKADAVTIAAIEAGVPSLIEARALVDRFQAMVRTKNNADLDPWIAEAKTSLVASFVTGIVQDKAAVSAAMTEPWSNGQVEAQITKLKLVKRQMYGRAKIDLLQARLLGAA